MTILTSLIDESAILYVASNVLVVIEMTKSDDRYPQDVVTKSMIKSKKLIKQEAKSTSRINNSKTLE
jgi:hypothetical protein